MKIIEVGPGWIVVDKPPGLLSTPGRFEPDSIIAQLRARGIEANAVHRLDMDTSGLMVLATDSGIHRALSIQFQTRTVSKSYLARLQRRVSADAGVIVLPFRLDPRNRPRQVFDPVHGKLGFTDFCVLDRGLDSTRVRFWPRTGRTHQLRLHAAHPVGLGAPIVGDCLYGRPSDRLWLDADRLSFDCPTTGRRRHFRRPSMV
ncbi:MAG: RluA family pseudouridine synthase [Myxococcota bacterium]